MTDQNNSQDVVKVNAPANDGEGEYAMAMDAIEKQPIEKAENENTRTICHAKQCVVGFLDRNQFVILLLLAIVLAKAYPPLGAEYVQPDITATWIAVMLIFLISGMGLKLEEVSKAFQRFYFNAFVQIFNFGLVSATVFGISRLLKEVGAINSALADGMVICSCLPVG